MLFVPARGRLELGSASATTRIVPRRAAQIHDFVAISGHATVEMQQLYSSVDGAEVRSGLAKVISWLAFYVLETRPKPGQVVMPEAGGDPGGDREDRGLTMQAG